MRLHETLRGVGHVAATVCQQLEQNHAGHVDAPPSCPRVPPLRLARGPSTRAFRVSHPSRNLAIPENQECNMMGLVRAAPARRCWRASGRGERSDRWSRMGEGQPAQRLADDARARAGRHGPFVNAIGQRLPLQQLQRRVRRVASGMRKSVSGKMLGCGGSERRPRPSRSKWRRATRRHRYSSAATPFNHNRQLELAASSLVDGTYTSRASRASTR